MHGSDVGASLWIELTESDCTKRSSCLESESMATEATEEIEYIQAPSPDMEWARIAGGHSAQTHRLSHRQNTLPSVPSKWYRLLWPHAPQ